MLAFVVTVPAGESELAADALWALGVAAIEERGCAGVDAMVELWTGLGDDPGAVTKAADGFPARWRWRLQPVATDVVDRWREHAVATWVTNDLVIVPAWKAAAPAGGRGHRATRIVIDPGAAFGLGDHPTTRLSARLLWTSWWSGATVADIGCGSGVLSVIAARRGAPFVEAIDISPAAVEATTANAARNGVGERVSASTRRVGELEGPFDIVVANILAPALIDMADDLRRLTARAGLLIVSGLLADGHDRLTGALAPMRVVERAVTDAWAALTLRH